MAKRSAEEAAKRAEEASKARDAQREKARAALEEKDRQLDDARRRIVLAEEEKSEASRANEKTETAAETGRRPGTGDVAVVSGTGSAIVADASSSDGPISAYARNVVQKYLVTDDWETQDSLVPVIGAVLGFSDGDLASVRAKRDAMAPLALRAVRMLDGR